MNQGRDAVTVLFIFPSDSEANGLVWRGCEFPAALGVRGDWSVVFRHFGSGTRKIQLLDACSYFHDDIGIGFAAYLQIIIWGNLEIKSLVRNNFT